MNKLKKILLAVLAGIDVVFYFITPILLSMVWVKLFGFNNYGDYVIYIIGLFSCLFRGIKIGFLKNG